MSPDDFKQAWQAQSSQTRLTVDADLLLKEVQRNQESFIATIFWRDFREVLVAVVLLPVWFYLGSRFSLPWTWYLTVPALVWVAGFILVDRMRHNRQPGEPGEPLRQTVKESLGQVEHQIWLLRNVFWWYLLPFTISILSFFVHVAWLSSRDWWGVLGLTLFVVVPDAAIYWLNQRAVRSVLEPRRQELETLLTSLEDETAGGQDAAMQGAGTVRKSGIPRRSLFVAGVCVVAVAALSAAAHFVGQQGGYPRRAPYSAIRWERDQPVVQIGDEWFELVSLDGIAAEEIVDFSRRTYANLWQKRFEEDLVEVLSKMGHEPEDTVRLVVRPLGSSETRTLEDVPMTEANRRAIRNAAQARERDEQQQGMRRAVPIDDAARFRARIDEFLDAARSKAGFSGAVLVACGGQPVYEGAFGLSHMDLQVPNTLDTPFRIASLSKQFTAAAIFRLEADGKLNIDDPVHRYLPEFAESPYRKITTHQLLTHTSGLPRIATGLMGPLRWNAMSRAPTPVDDYVRLAVEQPLAFEPGTDYQYSNFGYRVLSALITRVTGREYADFMEQEIFQPLGMKDTGVARGTRPPSEARIAEGLMQWKLPFASQPRFANGENGRNYGAGYGSGGIYSSANDLLGWDRVLAGDEFLTEIQKTRLFQPIHGYYACGWVVKKSGLDGRLYQMHSGANQGFFSRMMRIPEDDLVIIAVGNVQATPEIDEVIEQLFRLCRSLPYRDS